jgi:hypothetical protein
MVQPALALAVLLLAIVSLRWYFVQYTPLLVYGNVNAVVATALGKYAHTELGPNTHIYFFGPPRMFYGFGTIPYLAPQVSGTDIAEPLTQPPGPDMVLPNKGAAFVFLPERRAELSLVQQAFPGGTLMEMPSPLGTEPLFIVYRINALQ